MSRIKVRGLSHVLAPVAIAAALSDSSFYTLSSKHSEPEEDKDIEPVSELCKKKNCRVKTLKMKKIVLKMEEAGELTILHQNTNTRRKRTLPN